MVRNWTLATNFDFQIPKSMQPDDIVHLSYFKLRLFDKLEFLVWNTSGDKGLVGHISLIAVKKLEVSPR